MPTKIYLSPVESPINLPDHFYAIAEKADGKCLVSLEDGSFVKFVRDPKNATLFAEKGMAEAILANDIAPAIRKSLKIIIIEKDFKILK